MTSYVLVHGAWHGPWAWDGVAVCLRAAGVRTLIPDLTAAGDRGLHDDARTVAAALDGAGDDELVLIGHSYAGLVAREAADLRPDRVDHVVLVDGWAGPDGSSVVSLAPEAFGSAIHAAAGTGRSVPPPPPAAFGAVDPPAAARLAERLVPQPLRTFTESTRLTGAVDAIPGTAVHCRPQAYPFDRFAAELGYAALALDGPHDVMLTDPDGLARLLLTASSFESGKRAV